MKKFFLGGIFVFVAGIIATFLFAGGDSYNTDFPPPRAEATFGELVPDSIQGMAHQIQPLSVGDNAVGMISRYGDDASIILVKSADQAVFDALAAKIIDRLEPFSSRMSGKFNGAWSIKAAGAPGHIYAWQKQNWFYSIETANDAQFQEVVEKFDFIAIR